jgi:hypothetical protein
MNQSVSKFADFLLLKTDPNTSLDVYRYYNNDFSILAE